MTFIRLAAALTVATGLLTVPAGASELKLADFQPATHP